jgi:acyl-coenzyme A thioesterase PaaI-like protein
MKQPCSNDDCCVEKAMTKNAIIGHSRCLLCGDLNPRSFNLSFDDESNGVVRTRFTAQPELQGYDDILHGGIIAALLDAAMTHCLFHQGVQAVTGDLHVRFLHPIPCKVPLDIRANVLFSRPPLFRLRSEITIEGKIMAWAEAKFVQR